MFTKTQSADVVPLPKKEAARGAPARKDGNDLKNSEAKWGVPVIDLGFCIVPSLLLQAQQHLRLTSTQLAIILHLADHWWEPDRKPYPSKKRLSERLGVDPRTVQRNIAELEAHGLVTRIERTTKHRGKTSNEYDLGGLVKRLQEIEPQFRKAKEEIKEIRTKVSRRGGTPPVLAANVPSQSREG